MQCPASFEASARRKATWGSRLLLAAMATVLCVSNVDAAPKTQKPVAVTAQLDAADRKLDRTLRERKNKPGDSDVIIELTDDGDDTSVLRGYGVVGRKLHSFNGRVLRIPNRLMTQLAANRRVKRIIDDRDVWSHNGRTAVTIGSRTVIDMMGYTGAGVGVAVIDSGVSAFHQDLTAGNSGTGSGTGQRVTHFKDFVNNAAMAYDDWGHGTHVAGIVAGNGSASYGRHEGIAPGANIVVLKALNGQGHSKISTIIAAIDYAIAVKNLYNIRVLNLSLGAGVYESYQTDPLTIAAKRAVDAGIVVVAAAGNLGAAKTGAPQYGAITSPGNAPWVLTVGASSTMGTLNREDDTIAGFSSRGPTMHDYLAKPDLVAPGTGSVSLSDPLSLFYTTKASSLVAGLVPGLSTMPYLSLSGTSMSAPVVAGTVALMLHANPSLTPNMVKAILQFTAQRYPSYNALTQGTGFLNARGAVTLAEYFRSARAGDAYPDMKGWSREIFWGNYRVNGGVILPAGNAWDNSVVWGSRATASGQNIVWGQECDPTDPNCNIVWGNECDPTDPNCNIVWGNECDPTDPNCNIVWGNECDPTDPNCNIVWGNSCEGDNCENIVWGNECDPNDPNCNIVWGNSCDPGDPDCNIVWGNTCDPSDPVCNIVWGNSCDPSDPVCNIVWGNTCDPSDPVCNIVWGNSLDGLSFGGITPVDLSGEVNPIDAFDTRGWDALFRLSDDILRGVPTTVPTPISPTLISPTLTSSLSVGVI